MKTELHNSYVALRQSNTWCLSSSCRSYTFSATKVPYSVSLLPLQIAPQLYHLFHSIAVDTRGIRFEKWCTRDTKQERKESNVKKSIGFWPCDALFAALRDGYKRDAMVGLLCPFKRRRASSSYEAESKAMELVSDTFPIIFRPKEGRWERKRIESERWKEKRHCSKEQVPFENWFFLSLLFGQTVVVGNFLADWIFQKESGKSSVAVIISSSLILSLFLWFLTSPSFSSRSSRRKKS